MNGAGRIGHEAGMNCVRHKLDVEYGLPAIAVFNLRRMPKPLQLLDQQGRLRQREISASFGLVF